MRADSKETTERLLDVAERLFAKEGIENVPVTRIVGSSKARNRSALHYHFGSREGVLKAVLDRRLSEINDVRNAMLDEDPQAGKTLIGAVRAAVAPLCLMVLNRPWGPDYVSVLAQVRFHPVLLGENAVDDANLSSVRRCLKVIEDTLPTISRAVLARRFRWLTDSMVLEVARWSSARSKSVRTRQSMDGLVEELIAYGTMGLAAPPAPIRSNFARKQINLDIIVGRRG
jgi:AcrR family transcriptional regulator